MSDVNQGFRIGPFSTGDLIALASVVFFSGANWFRVQSLENQTYHQVAELERLTEHVQTAQLVIPQNYVRRDEYHDDLAEIKQMLQMITQDLKDKEDKK